MKEMDISEYAYKNGYEKGYEAGRKSVLDLCDFDGAVLNCAVRYCLGRQSYMPGLVVDQLIPKLHLCSDKTLYNFEKDVNGYIADHGKCYDDILDKWRTFANKVKDEIKKRQGDNNDC